jgi:dihydroneopterin aldolase
LQAPGLVGVPSLGGLICLAPARLLGLLTSPGFALSLGALGLLLPAPLRLFGAILLLLLAVGSGGLLSARPAGLFPCPLPCVLHGDFGHIPASLGKSSLMSNNICNWGKQIKARRIPGDGRWIDRHPARSIFNPDPGESPAVPADVLRLRNMRFYAYHGLFPEENALGQLFEVDLELCGDFSAAGQSDDLERAINYPEIYKLVEEVVTGQRCKLVEALAERIAARVGARCAPVELVVRVRKPHPPVQAHFDGIEVELHRTYG